MTGGLFDPLGTDRTASRGGGLRPTAPVVAAALALGAVAILLAVSWFRDDGDRGRPVAVAPIEHVQAPQKPPPAAPIVPQSSTPSGGLPPLRDDQEVEIQNGVRIVRPRRDGPGSQTIRVPESQAPR